MQLPAQRFSQLSNMLLGCNTSSVGTGVRSAPKPALVFGAAVRGRCAKQQPSFVPRAEGESNGVSQFVQGPVMVNPSLTGGDSATGSDKSSKPVDRSKGLWTRCDKCGVILYIKHLKENHHICFGCNFHLKMTSQERINHLIDPGTWRSFDETLSPTDPLEFTALKTYPEQIKEAQTKTGLQDGVVTGTGLLHGIPVALGVMEFGYMGGSMGSVVGEKLTRLIEYATQEGLTLLIVCTSGGARMQEGILSLMQMAKISAALHVHQNSANLMYIAILTSPTTGGVTASFGMLGDIIIAEPQAIIGFAGRRVIEQTLNEQLPDDFQTAEYLLDKGLLDLVVPRSFLKGALYEILDFYKDATYKKRGQIPFGVQRASYLNTEEKMRRKFAEWNKSSSGLTAGSGVELGASDDASLSYQDLVNSFKVLTNTPEDAIDAREMLGSEGLLAEAAALAKTNYIKWAERVDGLLIRKEEKQFAFKMEP